MLAPTGVSKTVMMCVSFLCPLALSATARGRYDRTYRVVVAGVIAGCVLAAVVLHDQLLVDRRVDLLARRQLDDFGGLILIAVFEPFRSAPVLGDFKV